MLQRMMSGVVVLEMIEYSGGRKAMNNRITAVITASFGTVLLLILASGAESCREKGLDIINVDSTALHVGIAGDVRKSPISPVDLPGVENSAPLPGAHITIRRVPADLIGQVVSDSGGRFFVDLDPGTYTLTPESFGSNPFPTPPDQQQIVVPQNGIVSVRIDYDTGIR
jgi:hypothetical protein